MIQNIMTAKVNTGNRRLSAPKVETGFHAHGQSGHRFHKKTFTRPTYCHHCTELLWGFTNQGFICEVCNFVTHDRCLSMVITPCISIATTLMNNPVEHTWDGVSFYKKKYCNICRKRLEDNPALRCQVCEYFVHENCQEFSINDCKQSTTYTPHLNTLSLKQSHHWREGNLPASSKCVFCKRTCGTMECLASYRCSWCQQTAHSGCFEHLPKECQFGYIKRLSLPPSCVSLLNVQLWRKANKVEPLQNGVDHPINTQELLEKDYTSVNIYDGNLRELQTCKSVIVPRTSQVEHILLESLKKFCINDEAENYYLAKAVGQEKERPMDKEEMPVQFLESEERPLFFLRNKKADKGRGFIKVYAGQDLNLPAKFKNILVGSNTIVEDVIKLALQKYGLEDTNSDVKYVLTEMYLYSGLQERCMERHESPWKILTDVKQKSLEMIKYIRFYLCRKPDTTSLTCLCIGNLPSHLDKQKYQELFDEIFTEKLLDVQYIHPGSGMLFATVSSPDMAADVIETLTQTPVDGKDVFVKLLPTIHPELIPHNSHPLLVFVNPKSGGGQGDDIMSAFQRLLNPHQVYNLLDGGPLPGLFAFKDVEKFRILICGGDGTVGWVLSCLDDLSCILKCKKPPSAIVPLGTGNDLSRVLNWGGGYSSSDTPLSLLMAVDSASVGFLDRWLVMFDSLNPLSNTREDEDDDEPNMFVMNNYFGIGIDADLSLDFHLKREEAPDKFTSRLHNKGVYFRAGLRKMAKRSDQDISNEIEIEVDGEKIDLPSVEGIVILNIGSWAAGADLWGPDKEDKQFLPLSHSDGLVEVVGLTGIMQMGQIQSGMRSGLKIAQGSQINIKLKSELPVHIDGEPWMQSAGQIIIRPSLLQAAMLTKRKVKTKEHFQQAAASRPTSAPVSRSTFYFSRENKLYQSLEKEASLQS